MANKQKSLKFLEGYFNTTPPEQILEDMRRHWPDIELGQPSVQKVRWWRQLWHRFIDIRQRSLR